MTNSVCLIHSLRKLENLVTLYVSRNNLSGAELEVISSLTSLRELTMMKCKISQLPPRYVYYSHETPSFIHYIPQTQSTTGTIWRALLMDIVRYKAILYLDIEFDIEIDIHCKN